MKRRQTQRQLASSALQRFLHTDHGVSAVELAMVLPILMLLVMGVVDFGRIFVTGAAISSAAETGAQYGAQSVATSVDTVGMRVATVNDFNTTRLGTGLVVTASWQCRCPTNDAAMASCTNTTPCGTGQIAPRVYVQVQASKTVRLAFRYPGFPATVNVLRRAVVRAQ